MNNKNRQIALYRKHRPETFDDVIGQDHVVRVIANSIKLGNISHAYLFAGSRGTGKTSVARIFARAIGTSDTDLYEMDAASNRGIDDIREIRRGVNTVPFESKYKVYIIDEAHMLSKDAFNALLKTLEEPPSHAIFILATTELEKLPETVVSRCQTFAFKKPNQEILRGFITAIATKEGYTLAPAAADLIALLGDGSFRDAQGILQKVISASGTGTVLKVVGADTVSRTGRGANRATTGKMISREEVELVTGAPKGAIINAFIDSLAEKNLQKGIAALHSAAENNIDMLIFSKLILEKLRFILLLTNAPDMSKEIESRVSAEDFAYLKKLAAKNLSFDVLAEILKASQLIGRAFIPELPLELALMRIVDDKKQTK